MYEIAKEKKLSQAKSYSSIYDIIGVPDINDAFACKTRIKKPIEELVTKDVDGKTSMSYNSDMLNVTSYVTSERYHSLNKKASDKSVVRSTSTLFYDLDGLAKRHSYHCIKKLPKTKDAPQPVDTSVAKNGFGAKSEAIVQECATQLKPRLTEKKKIQKSFPKESILSSEIFLKDNQDTYSSHKSHIQNAQINDRHQKFWSFAKYRTEYTNPVNEDKKTKKKDRGKRTEDPCPCQLFSYACPCTNKKSLTELAKNSKSLTVADQITSTPQLFLDGQKDKSHKNKKTKENFSCDNKLTSTIDVIGRKSKEALVNETHTRNRNNIAHKKFGEFKTSNDIKHKCLRKPRQVLCPNCKEMVDVMSNTEEEESLTSKSSPLYHENELPATAAYTYRNSNGEKCKVVENGDTCSHEPQCELVPVCQILPTDNIYVSPNCTNKHSPIRHNPRVIRITKGCRHHPPCTVVPSCQRINVLNNNCEYIPPCLHRPRCVNLPLCAPLSKSIYYDETISKPEEDLITTDCPHILQNRCQPTHQHDSTENHQINRVQNTCEYLSECSPRFVINPNVGCVSPSISPCQAMSHSPCNLSHSPCNITHSPCTHCTSDKLCQYDFFDCKHNFANNDNEIVSNDDVVFIRDVGCQFRNKNCSPKDSYVQSKTSSASFNCVNMNVNKYSTNFHTLRYEDKCTNPICAEEISVSTVTLSSTEIDSQCPAHGNQYKRDSHKARPTGFVPKSNMSPLVAYTHTDPIVNFCSSANDNFKKKSECHDPEVSDPPTNASRNCVHPYPVKSRRSFLKGKYKKMFPIKRKRKSSTSYHYVASSKRVQGSKK